MFFVDRALGRHDVPEALRAAGARVETHDDHFASDAPDTDWLTVVGSKAWIVLTKDDRIRYRETEVTALLGSGVRAFVLAGGNLSGPTMGEIFVLALRRMVRLAQRHPHGFVAVVRRSGEVVLFRKA